MTKEEKIQHLYQAILNLQSEEACAAFFEDLCTNKELEQMAERAYAARLLMEGKTYSQIIAQAEFWRTDKRHGLRRAFLYFRTLE